MCNAFGTRLVGSVTVVMTVMVLLDNYYYISIIVYNYIRSNSIIDRLRFGRVKLLTLCGL